MNPPMYDDHRQRPSSRTYRRTATGFGLSAIGIGLLCADSFLELGFILSFAPELRKLLLSPVWRLGVGGSITLLTFLGSYAIWLRFDSSRWARASTLLMLMNGAHVALWLVANHAELGLPDQRIGHAWLRGQVSQIMNWTEFACWIALVRELGRFAEGPANPIATGGRLVAYPGFVVVGLMTSIGVTWALTDWSAWPLERVAWLGPLDSLMLATATTMLMLAASMQITVDCYRGARTTLRLAIESADAEQDEPAWTVDHFDEDPWGTRGETADYPIW